MRLLNTTQFAYRLYDVQLGRPLRAPSTWPNKNPMSRCSLVARSTAPPTTPDAGLGSWSLIHMVSGGGRAPRAGPCRTIAPGSRRESHLGRLPNGVPARLLASLPAFMPSCLLAFLYACLHYSRALHLVVRAVNPLQATPNLVRGTVEPRRNPGWVGPGASVSSGGSRRPPASGVTAIWKNSAQSPLGSIKTSTRV